MVTKMIPDNSKFLIGVMVTIVRGMEKQKSTFLEAIASHKVVLSVTLWSIWTHWEGGLGDPNLVCP